MKDLEWIANAQVVYADDEFAAYRREAARELSVKLGEIVGPKRRGCMNRSLWLGCPFA